MFLGDFAAVASVEDHPLSVRRCTLFQTRQEEDAQRQQGLPLLGSSQKLPATTIASVGQLSKAYNTQGNEWLGFGVCFRDSNEGLEEVVVLVVSA